jgi:PKHD-type hydroxylase
MPYMLAQPKRESVAPYVFFEDLFTSEECDKIVELSKTIPVAEAKIGSEESGGGVNKNKRRSELHWIEWNNEYNWIFDRLAENIVKANQKWWGYHLAGMNEALQLTHYKSEDLGHYDWHEDHGDSGNFLHRKLSIVTLLSDNFEGGDFELFHLGKIPELKKGSMIIFPSFKIHRVTPVTKGERWSLVNWVNGPAFV